MDDSDGSYDHRVEVDRVYYKAHVTTVLLYVIYFELRYY